MKVPPGQLIEERIRDDVHEIIVLHGRLPRLAYLVNPQDAKAMLMRLRGEPDPLGCHDKFEMHTEGGYVTLMADPNHPRGETHRMVICKCGGLALYTPGVEQCVSCLTLRPYAPGEKMTDRHPDSVIAQVVEETIAKQVEHLATPIKVRSPYAPLPPVGEPAFRLSERDGALFVDTAAGPVKITGDLAELRKSAPSTPGKQWVTPVVYKDLPAPVITTCPGYNGVADLGPARRPDGFDQHQVDAAKAALLAPAPPRYARAGGRR